MKASPAPPSSRRTVPSLGWLAFALLLASCVATQPKSLPGQAPEPQQDRPAAFRSALDGRPRMLTADLGGNLWVAYDAKTASLYKVWRDGVLLEGAVYDYRHGPQPRAAGPAYLLRTARNPWRLVIGDREVVPEVRYRGHRKIEGGVVVLLELRYGETAIAAEERVTHQPGVAPTLRWDFSFANVPANIQIEYALELDSLAVPPTTDGTLRDVRNGPGTRMSGILSMKRGADTILTARFSEPAVPEVVDPEVDARWAQFEELGCPSCHATEAKTVGPSLLDIAERYDADPATVTRLSGRVRSGGSGIWGAAAMPAQDFLGREQSEDLVRFILALDGEDAHTQRFAGELRTTQDRSVWEQLVEHGPRYMRDAFAGLAASMFEEAPPTDPGDGLPVPGVHPSFDLQRIRPDDFQPKVGGMGFLSNGDLIVSSWDEVGAVYRVSGVTGDDPSDVRVQRIAWGLAEPLGVQIVDDEIYVLQKHELTRLVDRDGDSVTDEYQTVSNDWEASANFHEFAFGLATQDDAFLATLSSGVMPGGHSSESQPIDRGAVLRIQPDGRAETISRGLRTPNGIGEGAMGELFVTDNQGAWLPASKIVHVKPGTFYGFRDVDPEGDADLAEDPPVVWLPQNEIGNSPSEPAPLDVGPYRNQMVYGDVHHGGIKRVFVESVGGQLQGAVFRFSQGFEAGVNRLRWGPDGKLYVGGIGNPGNWGHPGQQWFGLERLAYNGDSTFEILAIRAQPDGFEVELTQPLAPGRGENPADYRIRQWRYEPTEAYGGPKIDLEALDIESIQISKDRRRVALKVPGLNAGSVVHVRLAPETIQSRRGDSLWTTEAWYTLNQIPSDT